MARISSGGSTSIASGDGLPTPAEAGTFLVSKDGAFAETTTELVWDDTNKRLGVGTDTPLKLLDVGGSVVTRRLPSSSVAPVATLNETAGNLNNTYKYKVYFFTAEMADSTGSSFSNSVSPVNQQVDLTIPVSTNPLCTGRYIYRGKFTSSYSLQLIATINDNTTTSYTDNVADTTLASVPVGAIVGQAGLNLHTAWKTNEAATSWSTGILGKLGTSNIALGYTALNANARGSAFAIGQNSLKSSILNNNAIAIGYYAMYSQLSTNYDIAIGYQAFYGKAHHAPYNNSKNIFIGDRPGYNCGTVNYNVGIGSQALYNNVCGDENVAIGTNTLFNHCLRNGTITAIADAGGGNITCTSANHALNNGDVINIFGTLNYDFINLTVSNVTVSTFDVVRTYVGNETTGRWVYGGALDYDGVAGGCNVAIGGFAGSGITTGRGNLNFGWFSGEHHKTSSSENICIGPRSGPSVDTTESGKLYIGIAAGTPLIGGDFYTSTVTFAGSVGIFGTAPPAQPTGYAPTNVSTDRVFDANATTTEELADVLGTLIEDLKLYGILAGT